MSTCPVCKKKKAFFFCNKGTYTYFSCKNCSTVFLRPIPTQRFIDHFYDKGYPYNVDSTSARRMRLNAVKILKHLLAIHPTGKTLLDVGSGYGDFLDAIKNSDTKGLGIEPAINLYRFSKKRGLPIEQMTMSEFSKTNKKIRFDFITVVHLIEHVNSPAEFITQCARHLKKGGVMYIETPNIDSHLFKAERENYTFLTPPDHTILFSPKSLRTILSQKNLAIHNLHTFSYPEHIAPILRSHKKSSKTMSSNVRQEKMRSSQPLRRLKFFVGNQVLYPLLTPLLNIGDKGSILACYVRKTS